MDSQAFMLLVDRVYLVFIVSWCNGSTSVSESACLGSNPSETTASLKDCKSIDLQSFLFYGVYADIFLRHIYIHSPKFFTFLVARFY